MAIVASFASAKHSPGTTTACLAVAVALAQPPQQPRRRRARRVSAPSGETVGLDPALVVEADPCGGDLAARLERAASGLETLAPAARHSIDDETILGHSQFLRDGLALLAAPLSAAEADAALRAVARRLADHLADSGLRAVVDCGRLTPTSPSLALAQTSDVLLWVTRSTLEDAAHLLDRLRALRDVAPDVVRRSRLLMVAEGPYSIDEFAGRVGLAVVGTLPFDPPGVDVLHGRRSGRSTDLGRGARDVVRALTTREAAEASSAVGRTREWAAVVDEASR